MLRVTWWNVRYTYFQSSWQICSSRFCCVCFSRALPPPAHHASARPVLATHPTHPLPAHMQPAAVFPAHPQVAASYGFAPLSPAKSHQYQPSLWFTEWEGNIAQMDPTWNSHCSRTAVELSYSWYETTRSSAERVCFPKQVPIDSLPVYFQNRVLWCFAQWENDAFWCSEIN
jgi:hypothetical protein